MFCLSRAPVTPERRRWRDGATCMTGRSLAALGAITADGRTSELTAAADCRRAAAAAALHATLQCHGQSLYGTFVSALGGSSFVD